ncbi:putative phage abortive infection protein [bacterium]|nr:putative phage abortive infection protein [bacterium]MBU4023951.1 putative phage abortive infection protein [bacterium]MBU4058300.1 putative phage abortive infection protein [bacterium]
MQENKNNFLKFLKLYIGIAIFIYIVVVGMYFFNFKEYGLSPNQGVWGTFGDFVGGTLNPIFAMMSFIALLSTIKLQSEELALTREELEKSSKALMEQSDSFKIQNDSIKQQNFENTFFKMIDLHNQIVNNLVLTQKQAVYSSVPQKYKINNINVNLIDNKDYLSKKVIARLLEIFTVFCKSRYGRQIDELYNNFHNEYQEIIGHYYGNIYQILKLIDTSNIEDKKRYSSLYRAQFSVAEIELLAYHCLSKVAVEKFKPLIEKYQFLEHIDKKTVLDEVINLYDKNAFGEKIVS